MFLAHATLRKIALVLFTEGDKVLLLWVAKSEASRDMCFAWRNYSYAYARQEIGRRVPSRTRNGFVSDGLRFQWFSTFLSRVWSESVKSPSKNVCGGGDDGVDAGDVFRSRPEQILQIIRTWRRFREKESCFFSSRRQILEIAKYVSVFCTSSRTLHLFRSPLHNFSVPRRRRHNDTAVVFPRARPAHSLPLSAKKIFFKIKFWKQFGPPSDRRRRMEGCANLAVKSKPSAPVLPRRQHHDDRPKAGCQRNLFTAAECASESYISFNIFE